MRQVSEPQGREAYHQAGRLGLQRLHHLCLGQNEPGIGPHVLVLTAKFEGNHKRTAGVSPRFHLPGQPILGLPYFLTHTRLYVISWMLPAMRFLSFVAHYLAGELRTAQICQPTTEGPPASSALLYPFFWGGFTWKKGTLILTSPLSAGGPRYIPLPVCALFRYPCWFRQAVFQPWDSPS